MPYVETVNWDTVPSSIETGSTYAGDFRIRGSRDVSWRTGRNLPIGKVQKILPVPSVEPYSWYVANRDLSIRAHIKDGFDASVFRKDVGHAWENEKWEIKYPLWKCSMIGTTFHYKFNNVLPAWGSSAPFAHAFVTPTSGLESWAALQYGRMAPLTSEFSLTSFLGELREGLPRLVIAGLQPKAKVFKSLGDDYLNAQFGWVPFMNDLRSLAKALLDASYGLYRPFGATHRSRDALITDSLTRRDDGFIPISAEGGGVTKFLTSYPGSGVSATGGPSVSGLATVFSRTKVNRSIEGEFVYIPKAGFDPSKYMDRYESLMSLDITPGTLWQLTPWSWLVDWFSDIGGAIASMESAVSNRVLSTYLYAMEETVTTVTSQFENIRPRFSTSGAYYGPQTVPQQLVYSRKRRIRANPFGFTGSSTTHLTGEKWAILGALGLTRLK